MSKEHTAENDAPRRHLMDEWPYDPLPAPFGNVCNAEYVVAGVLVGHCGVRTSRKGTHKGKHRIEWDTSVTSPEVDQS